MISFFVQWSIKLRMKISHEESSLIKMKPDQDVEVWHDTLTWNHGERVSGKRKLEKWTRRRNKRVVGGGCVERTKGRRFTKWLALLIGSICSLLKLKILVSFSEFSGSIPPSNSTLYWNEILWMQFKSRLCYYWMTIWLHFFIFPTSIFKVGSLVLQVVWSGCLEPVISS